MSVMIGKQTYDALTVVDRVDEWLAVNDASQTELARRARVTGGYVNTWWSTLRRDVMSGKQKTVARATMIRLVSATGMSVDELTEPFK